MEWFANLLRHYPELAIFLTLAFGFWIGKFKIKKFTLGTVTSVLLVGVLIGQLHIDIGAYIPEGSDGNNYPVVVGGGYRMDGATVMVLQKKGKEMTLRVLNAKGETLKELNL